MAKIIDSAGKGSAITAAEHDSNLSTFAGKNQSITATSHTIDVDDQGETIEYSNASPIAVTLPAISTVSGSNIHTDDFTVTLKNIGAGLVTVTRGGTDTFEDGSTSYTIAQYGSVTIQTDSTLGKWNIISRGFGTTYNDSLTFAGTLTVSGTANISGTWQISGTTVTASAAKLNYNDITTLGTVQASKTVTADANKRVTGLDSLTLTGVTPRILFNETDATTDEKWWDVIANGGNLSLRSYNDALSSASTFLDIARTGSTVDSVTITPPLIASGGVTGNLTGNVTGNLTATTITKASIPVYGMVILDETTSILSTTSAVGSWTTLSTGAPAGATAAILRCDAILSDAIGPFNNGSSQQIGYIKSVASTSGADASTMVCQANTMVDNAASASSIQKHDINDVIVNLDASRNVQYQTFQSLASGVTGTFIVRLVGYYV